MEVAKTTQESDKFILRLPDGMRDTIKIRAAQNRRTMNAEILILIERALAEGEQKPSQK